MYRLIRILVLIVVLVGGRYSSTALFAQNNPEPYFTMCTDVGSDLQEGILYDSGGPDGYYSDFEDCGFLITSPCSTSIVVTINSIQINNQQDVLYVYDGVDSNAPLIYSSYHLPTSTIVAESGQAYIRFKSGIGLLGNGFEISWDFEYSTDPVMVDFSMSDPTPMFNSPVQFIDNTVGVPYSWTWIFGDGEISTEQNPVHSFGNTGDIDVKLIVENCLLVKDSLVKSISVQDAPELYMDTSAIVLDLNCGADTLIERMLYNLGDGPLTYDFSIDPIFETDTSLIYYQDFGFSQHIFELPNLVPDVDSLELQLTINGDFNYSNEFATLYIDGEFIEQIDDGDIGNGKNIIKEYVFSDDRIEEWLKDGIIEIEVVNSENVQPFDGGLDFHQVIFNFYGNEYLDIVHEGILNPGDSTLLSFYLDTEDLIGGTGVYSIDIQSNGLFEPFSIPLIINIVGDPELVFFEDCLVYPDVTVFSSSSMELVLANTGCAILELDSIITTNSAFTVEIDSLILLPGFEDTILVHFSPDTLGFYSYELNFYGNMPQTAFCLEGAAVEPPSLFVSQEEVAVQLVGCGDSSIVSVDISNLNGNDLFVDVELLNNIPDLDSVRIIMNNSIDNILNLLPDLYKFPEGISGLYINDAEGMYDTRGNRLEFNDYIRAYSDDSVYEALTLGVGGAFFTKKYPELFLFAGNPVNRSTFDIEGWINDSPNSQLITYELEHTLRGKAYSCFVKQMYNGENPSVNHMIIIEKDPDVIHDYSTSLGQEYDGLDNMQNVERLYYMLFSNENGDAYSESEFQDVFEEFIRLVYNGIDIELSYDNAIIPEGETETLDLLFSVNDLNSGIYNDTIVIYSNDSSNLEFILPLEIEVVGAPEMSLSAACLDFEERFQYSTSVMEFEITNTGCDDLIISDISIDNDDFETDINELTIKPDETKVLDVRFSPQLLGDYTANLILSGNISSDTICLLGSSVEGPFANFIPESIELDLESCQDSITVPLIILNSGVSSLEFSLISDQNEAGDVLLDSVVNRIESSYTTLTDQLPNLFNFSGGEEGSAIPDGGLDMYNEGNRLSFNNGPKLFYTNGLVTNLDSASYLTTKVPGLFVLAADINKTDSLITSFEISGNLGANGYGLVKGLDFSFENNGVEYRAYFKQVYGSSKPSVNHIILVREPSNSIQEYSMITNFDSHSVRDLSKEKRLYYLLFAGGSGFEYSISKVQQAAQTFLNIVEGNQFFTFDNSDYLVEAGDSLIMDITISVDHLVSGTYEEYIEIESNDPFQPNFLLPVSIDISDDLCADFFYSFDGGCNGEVEFFTAAVNNANTYLWDFDDGNISTEANPIHVYQNSGTYDVQFYVSNNLSTDTIIKTIEVDIYGPVSNDCLEGYGSPASLKIKKFSLNTIDNNTSFFNANYSDYTCDFSTELIIGVDYAFEIQGSNTMQSLDAAIWIDLNNDGYFEPSEEVFYIESTYSPINGTIIIPEGTVTGVPLRCRVAYDSHLEEFTSCMIGDRGEFEDYTVVVLPNELPASASFIPDILEDCQGAVQFLDQSGNFPTDWLWDFGDGNSSTLQDPYHEYEQEGVYNVKLTVSNEYGESTDSMFVDINFIMPDIEVEGQLFSGFTLSFDVNVSDAISYEWDFGDGNTSTEANPVHIYDEPGIYLVMVTVLDENDCLVSTELELSVITSSTLETSNPKNALIFPNPASERLFIENRSAMPITKIQVYNSLGQLVLLQEDFKNGEKSIELEIDGFYNGSYIIRLDFDGMLTEIHKVVLK